MFPPSLSSNNILILVRKSPLSFGFGVGVFLLVVDRLRVDFELGVALLLDIVPDFAVCTLNDEGRVMPGDSTRGRLVVAGAGIELGRFKVGGFCFRFKSFDRTGASTTTVKEKKREKDRRG